MVTTAVEPAEPVAEVPAAPVNSSPLENSPLNLIRRFLPRTLSPEEKAEKEARRRQREEIRLKVSMLEAEASECAHAIAHCLEDLEICFRRQDRKQERVKRIAFRRPFVVTEEALYLAVDLRPHHRPRGVGIEKLADPATLENLSITIGRRVEARYNPERGFFYIVWRNEGARGIPRHVKYDDCLALKPASADSLSFPLGMTEGKRVLWRSLGDMQSLLVAGTTGGGKSNLLNVIIATLISQNSPHQLKLALIDFKRVEFVYYKELPHLVKFSERKDGEVIDHRGFISELEEVVPVMNYIKAEMERRTTLLEEAKAKKLSEYNFHKAPKNRLPHIYMVIDELAELMLAPAKVAKEAKELLINIASKGRALGIGCIVCTQYPKAEVLDMRVKAVLPAVVAFAMPNMNASIAVLGNRAAFDIGEQGRYLFQFGRDQYEVQAPLIGNETIENVVNLAVQGIHYKPELRPRHDVTTDELFKWALAENDGKLTWRTLVAKYRERGFTKYDADRLIAAWEEKVVFVGNSTYTVRPGGPGVATRLMPAEEPVDGIALSLEEDNNTLELDHGAQSPETHDHAVSEETVQS